MRTVRLALVMLGIGLIAAGSGCSRRARTTRHSSPEGQASSELVPTPDNTPIEPLRTPAGLILKTGPETTVTPLPGALETTAPPPPRAAS